MYSILDFENGADLLDNIDNPINLYKNCARLTVTADGLSVFDTKMLDIPPTTVDWRQVKMTVNGLSYYEQTSFIRYNDGQLIWTNPTYKLQAGDIVFIEWVTMTVDYPGDINDKFLEIDDSVLLTKYGSVIYPVTAKEDGA